MSIFWERQTRHYLLFLIGGCIGLMILLQFIYQKQEQQWKQMLFAREQTIASVLLEEGVDKEKIAAAFNGVAVSAEGELLLAQIGHTKNVSAKLFPFLQEQLYTSGLQRILWGMLFCILLLSGTFWYFWKREQLYEAAKKEIQRFAEGDFHSHLPRNQTGALFQLFAEINELARALQAKSASEHQSKVFLQNTVSDISHQLKTPLAALNMYNEIMLEEPENADTVRKFAEKSLQSLNRMEILIQNMLKITRLDAGNIHFEKRQCNVKLLIQQSVADLEVRAKEERKTIVLEGLEEESLCCDALWTKEAIGNVVKNALEHIEAGGKVCIGWYETPLMMRITVADNGGGIAPEDIHHIFKRFYRSQNSKDTMGVGLGLPLAKSIVEKQGGILSVQSIPGEGTTFVFSFLTEL